MLPRPQGQADVLRHVPAGRDFVARVTERDASLLEAAGEEGSGADVLADPIPLFDRSTAG